MVYYLVSQSNQVQEKGITGTRCSVAMDKTFVNNVCRTCLMKNEPFIFVFDTIDVMSKKEPVNKILEECTILQVSLYDNFPKCICLSCIKKLQEVYEFREMCKESKEKFAKLLNVDNTLPEYDTNITSKEKYKRSTNEILSKERDNLHVQVEDIPSPDVHGESNTVEEVKDFEGDLESAFPCTTCNKMFGSKYSMHRHKKIHTNSVELTCEICQKQFSRKTDVKRHMLIHNGAKPYNCIVCNTSFSQSGTLSRHMRIHDEFKNTPLVKKRIDIKPHLCVVCGKSFKVSSSLNVHMRRHMGERRYKCTVCEMSFVCRSNLNNHMRTHTGERPFICAVCGKSTSHSSVLSRHMKTHQNLRPYMCDTCPKTFTTKYYLNIHKRKHTGEKPYECTVCLKVFADPKNFKHHLKIHIESKPFLCTFCGKAFRRKDHLTSHMGVHSK